MNYDAVVYDLDGTLVDLAVDWTAVRQEVARLLERAGTDPDGLDLWGLWWASKGTPYEHLVHRTMAEYEEAGARASTRLPAADAIPSDPGVGVCSLNAESAVHVALETHDLTAMVDAVVGRGTVPTEKPDPESLLETLERLAVDPGRAVFVGDSERDETAADRAGVPFRYVSEWV